MLAGLMCSGVVWAQEKDTFTPMALDAGFGPMDLNPPAMTPEEIIKKFAAKESEFQEALNQYTYRRIARVQTIDDDNKVDGECYEVDDVIFDPDREAHREGRLRPGKHAAARHDVALGSAGYPAWLSVCAYRRGYRPYDMKYVGRQKVDEVDCYVFDVSPKHH